MSSGTDSKRRAEPILPTPPLSPESPPEPPEPKPTRIEELRQRFRPTDDPGHQEPTGFAQPREGQQVPFARPSLPPASPAIRPHDDAPGPPSTGDRETWPGWMEGLPERVAFIDVETTGFAETDRIVTLAAIVLDTAPLAAGKFHMAVTHLVFDPGRKSHTRAEQVHGWSDWALRHQDTFGDHVEAIEGLVRPADLLVAHNAAFDLAFLDREFAALGRPSLANRVYCTMEGHSRSGLGGSAKLDACAARLGVRRSGTSHGALEDAWLAMRIYLAQHDCPFWFGLDAIERREPANLREVPALPEGPLPRRRPRRPPQAPPHK